MDQKGKKEKKRNFHRPLSNNLTISFISVLNMDDTTQAFIQEARGVEGDVSERFP
jgi:hypothetical protein